MSSSAEIARRFIDFINAHDVDGLIGLMSERHRFVDAHGFVMEGHGTLRTGWRQYFDWFPDYRIDVEIILEDGPTVMMAGFAEGTWQGRRRAGDHWRLPAAWRAEVRGGRMEEWQVYCDTKIVFDIMNKESS